jgi:hypothetical protein
MRSIITALDLLGGIAALIAAVIWIGAARVKFPQVEGADVVGPAPPALYQKLVDRLTESSRLNAKAAGWTAAAAGLLAIAAIFTAYLLWVLTR